MVARTKWGQADWGSRRGPGRCLSGAGRKRRPCRPHPANCCGLCSLQHFSSLFWNLAPILYLLDRLGHSHYTWLPRYLVHQQVVGNSCSFVCVFGCGCEGWTSQQFACSYFVSQTQWECSTHWQVASDPEIQTALGGVCKGSHSPAAYTWDRSWPLQRYLQRKGLMAVLCKYMFSSTKKKITFFFPPSIFIYTGGDCFIPIGPL